MAATGAGKDRHRATTRKLSQTPRQRHILGWVAVPGCQGSAVERRQAMATDMPMVSEHRHPRGTESARPGLGLMRAERGNPARVRCGCAGMRAGGGRPTVRGGGTPSGRTGCLGSERRRPKRDRKPQTATPGTPPGWSADNWPDTGPWCPALKGVLTWAGEPLNRSRCICQNQGTSWTLR